MKEKKTLKDIFSISTTLLTKQVKNSHQNQKQRERDKQKSDREQYLVVKQLWSKKLLLTNR